MDNSNLKETILVVVPCYNESPKKVNTILDDLLSYGFRNILLVDDGSTQKVKQNKETALVRIEQNLGQGYALNIGFEYAIKHNFKYVLTFDADGQHKAEEAEKLIKAVTNDKKTVILGSRFLEKSKIKDMPRKRRILIILVRSLINFFTDLHFTDVHNGLRLIPIDFFRNHQFTIFDFNHATEFHFLLSKTGFPFLEVDVDILYDPYSIKKSKISFKKVLKGIKSLFFILMSKQ